MADPAVKLTKLLPCPFCGQTPDVANPATFQVDEGSKWGAVVCCCTGPDVRTAYMPVEHWRDEAIEAWNMRVEPAGRALLDALKDEGEGRCG